MSEVSRSRVGHSLMAIALIVLFTGCVSLKERTKYAGCRNGLRNLNAPIACVDVGSLLVSPEPVRAFDRDKQDPNRPVQIVWLASDGNAPLRIETSPGCVERTFCNGHGMCRAWTVDVSKRQECKYTVKIGERVNDPVVIVVPCCMAIPEEPMTEIAYP